MLSKAHKKLLGPSHGFYGKILYVAKVLWNHSHEGKKSPVLSDAGDLKDPVDS